MTRAQTATEGGDILTNSGGYTGRYDSNGETCLTQDIVKRESDSIAYAPVIQFKDGALNVLWDTETVSPTRYKDGSFCGASEASVGDVLEGVVPKSGETPDTTVSDDLASLVSKVL